MAETPKEMPKVGDRYVLSRDVDRYPHALVAAGSAGVVVSADKDAIDLKLDEHIEGLDEWDNALVWYSDGFGMTVPEMISSFHDDAAPEEPAPTPGL